MFLSFGKGWKGQISKTKFEWPWWIAVIWNDIYKKSLGSFTCSWMKWVLVNITGLSWVWGCFFLFTGSYRIVNGSYHILREFYWLLTQGRRLSLVGWLLLPTRCPLLMESSDRVCCNASAFIWQCLWSITNCTHHLPRNVFCTYCRASQRRRQSRRKRNKEIEAEIERELCAIFSLRST